MIFKDNYRQKVRGIVWSIRNVILFLYERIQLLKVSRNFYFISEVKLSILTSLYNKMR